MLSESTDEGGNHIKKEIHLWKRTVASEYKLLRQRIFPAFQVPGPFTDDSQYCIQIHSIDIFVYRLLEPFLILTWSYSKHVETHEQAEGENEGRQQLRYSIHCLNLPTPGLQSYVSRLM